MRVLFLAVVLTASACGGHPPIPRRGVVEGDLGSWKFRRFQGPLLDVEVWVEGNKAEAYSASYITAAAEQRGHIEDRDLVNVFVTRYQTTEGVVRATVKLARRLAQERGYQVEEDKIAGARTLSITGRGEAWVMWPSNLYVVKVGGRGSAVPRSMVESYVDRFPSQLPGGSLEGPLPPGRDDAPAPSRAIDDRGLPPGGSGAEGRRGLIDKPGYDPSNPHPDIEHYDPSKVKIPDRKADDRDAAPRATTTEDGAPSPPADPARPKKPRRSK